MKKFLALVLVSLMMLSLVSCDVFTKKNEDIKGKTENVTEAGGTTAEKEFQLGLVTGKKWENAFIGFGCTLPSDWSFFTEEELKEANEISKDLIGDEYKEHVQNAKTFYDMFARSADNTCNINAGLEKVNAMSLASLDVAKNYEYIVPVLKATYEKMGSTAFSHEITSVTISEKEFPCLKITTTLNGKVMHQVVINVKCKGYLATISITALTPELVDTMVSNLYTLE